MSSPWKRVSKAVEPAGDLLCEISPFDPHFGKLGWREEVGDDYDLRIANARFLDTVQYHIVRAQRERANRILFPLGNDLLHIDNLLQSTTAGTLQDTDSRYRKIFKVVVQTASMLAQQMADVAPTTIVVVPGNHCTLGSFHVGEVLSALFEGHPRITVDNGAMLRKYVQHGRVLLGFTHGNQEKHADLPLIMAQEQPKRWAETTHREWHTGHFHKSKETRFTAGDSLKGVRVRILPSLSAADAWHFNQGYIGEMKACESYLWSASDGYVGHFSREAST
jgi:hypothetical protein